jgi:hypothetical protein
MVQDVAGTCLPGDDVCLSSATFCQLHRLVILTLPVCPCHTPVLCAARESNPQPAD